MQSKSAMNKVRVALLTIGALLLIASTANARVLSMTGEWFQNRGPLIDIPQAGGAVKCGPGEAKPGGVENGCVDGKVPLFGGIPGSGTVQATGSNPANFQIQTHAFSTWPGIEWVGAVPVAASIQQLASQFTFMGPARPNEEGQLGGAANMMANAWSNDPGQTARLAADFSWCPGGGAGGLGDGPGVNGCAAPNNATPNTGNWNGRVAYTAGPNQFGGTMSMMMGGIGYVSVKIPFGGGFYGIAHLIVNAGGERNPQVPGQGYKVRNFNNFPAAPIHSWFATNFSCTVPQENIPFGCGQIVAQGGTVGASVPADSQVNFGMPWTTGMMSIRNTGTNRGQPAETTLVATGTDMRTALGHGRITLIAGGTTHRYSKAQVPANPQNYAMLDIVTMEIGQSAVPAMSPMGLATAAVLMMLAGGYAFRRRLGGDK